MRATILLLSILLAAPAAAEPITAERVRVLDGDTIRVDGEKPDVRLVGFNAPETRRAKSDHERELGGQATHRLREILRTAGKLDLTLVPCACRPGTAGTPACNFGRSCGRLTADGRDVGDVLISEGLAVKFECGVTSCPKLPAPWR